MFCLLLVALVSIVFFILRQYTQQRYEMLEPVLNSTAITVLQNNERLTMPESLKIIWEVCITGVCCCCLLSLRRCLINSCYKKCTV